MNNKIAFINDTHAGARGNSLVVNDYFFQFYDNVFFPYLKANNIKHIFHLGDLVDVRKNMNYAILNHWNRNFFDRCKAEGIHFDAIVGNHDVAYKNTNKVNAIEELFLAKHPIRVFTEPQEIALMGKRVLLLPWINIENFDKSIQLIKDSDAKIVLGHLEIAGFEFDRGNMCHEGLDRVIFNKFDRVFSGHFHHKSSDGRIEFFGTQYEMTWHDHGDPKGFHVYDFDTDKLEFIENPNKLFYKHIYDEDNLVIPDVRELENKYVKILVKNKKSPDVYENFIHRVENSGPIDYTVVEQDMTVDFQLDTKIDETKTTLDILMEHTTKPSVKNLLKDLYLESQNMESSE